MKQTRLPLHSSSQRVKVRFWSALKDAPDFCKQLLLFLSAFTHSMPARWLQPHVLVLAAAEVCVSLFWVHKHKCAGEIFAIGQKGRWD